MNSQFIANVSLKLRRSHRPLSAPAPNAPGLVLAQRPYLYLAVSIAGTVAGFTMKLLDRHSLQRDDSQTKVSSSQLRPLYRSLQNSELVAEGEDLNL